MANLKSIRKRIATVKNTQKITRAMKMVAAARLSRAQLAITSLRPYALKTLAVLSSVASRAGEEEAHPLLARRPAERVMLVVMTSDRGLAGAFNASVCKAAFTQWKELEAGGADVSFAVIGRKGRDFLKRRNAHIRHEFTGVFENLSVERAGEIGRVIVGEYIRGGISRVEAEEREGRRLAPGGAEGPSVDIDPRGEVPHSLAQADEGTATFVEPARDEVSEPELDAVYLVYNEFKSAIAQQVVVEPLLPITPLPTGGVDAPEQVDFVYEPNKAALLDRLLPMYVEVEVYRALLESVASEHGARMTAMEAATRNAGEVIDRLTLRYNRARQAAITTELMEIIGGAEALKG